MISRLGTSAAESSVSKINKERPLEIRKSTESDKEAIEHIHIQAFGEKKGPEIAVLVNGLLGDKTALP